MRAARGAGRGIRRLAALLACATLAAGPAAAPAPPSLPRIAAQMPRGFGHHIGDLLVQRYSVEVPRSHALQRESLPAVGDIDYWLELRDVDVREEESSRPDTRRYALTLRYQTFYAPLDVRKLHIPGFTLRFAQRTDVLSVRVPAWSFTMSPTMQIVARGVGQGGGEQVFSMPDEAPRLLPTAQARRRVAALVLGTVVWGGFLAWRYGGWRMRSRAPFAAGLRAFAPLCARGDGAAYREALRVLHRALDATHGRPLFAEGLADFLAQRPAFASQRDALAQFFERSRATFFGDEPTAEPPGALFDELQRLLRECRRVERRG
ncbi:MAG: nonribosomal peptide synthetase MxaA [Gammaproteobacteria bacterium]